MVTVANVVVSGGRIFSTRVGGSVGGLDQLTYNAGTTGRGYHTIYSLAGCFDRAFLNFVCRDRALS